MEKRGRIMEPGFFPLCYADDEGEMQSGQADGKWSVAYFSEEEFDELFDMSAGQLIKWFTQRKVDQDGFDYDAGLALGPNGETNVALWGNFDEPWDVEVYSFQTKTGSFPDRFQDREDYTEWLSENLAG